MSPRRREILALSSAALASLAGCISGGDGTADDPTDQGAPGTETATAQGKDPRDEPDPVAWRVEPGGSLAAVRDGVLYGRESFQKGTGGLLAVDTMAGERAWRYGETGGYSTFTRPVVADDGVYAGFGDDAIGSGNGEVYALAPDGTEQWVTETGSVYHPPRVGDDAVFVGSDDGTVAALDRESGEARWTTTIPPTEESGPRAPEVAGIVGGVAVVELEERVLGLGAGDGSRRWRYRPDARVWSVTVEDQVYLTTGEELLALSGGEREWSCEHDGGRIEAVADGVVYLAGAGRVAAFDAADGTQRWFVRLDDYPAFVATDGAVYFGTTGLRKLAPDGETRWETGLDESEVRALVAGDDGVYAGTEDGVYRLDGGERVAEYAFGGTNLVVGDHVYAASREEIVALSL